MIHFIHFEYFMRAKLFLRFLQIQKQKLCSHFANKIKLSPNAMVFQLSACLVSAGFLLRALKVISIIIGASL